MLKRVVVAVAVTLSLAAAASAAGPNKCTSLKLKATGKKASARAKCYAKAVAKNAPVDSSCLSKASSKFSTAFGKAESKGACLAPNGDANAIEGKVDTFVDDVRQIVNNSGPGPNSCDSKKIGASGKKALGKAKCHAKAVAKGTPVDSACLGKAESKFSSAISKAEGAGGCTHTGQTNQLESAVNAFIDDVVGELEPPASSTTTTTISTTTTTTANPCTNTLGTIPTPSLLFTTMTGTTSCGSAGLTTPPSPPVSGEIDSNTAGTAKISDLGTSCLYFGGGNATSIAGGAIPNCATSVFGVSGGNTLVASPGDGPKSCTQGAGPAMECVNNNSTPACTSDLNCGGTAGACAPHANCYFGPPLPILSPPPNGALTTCVLNAIQTDASGSVILSSGDAAVNLDLGSRVYITGNTASPCPKCISGTCSYGADAGGSCTPVGSKMTTLDCRPNLSGFQASLPINITPLTTGHSILSAADGNFCPSQANAGAFGKPAARAIQQQGTAAGDLTDGLPHPSVLGYNFCIPATGAFAVDLVADLPGPGSLGLAGNSQYASPSGAFLGTAAPSED